MYRKIDAAWLSLFFSIPGLFLAIFFYLLPLLGVSTFEFFFGRPAVEIEGIILLPLFFGLGALHLTLLIPAWILLRRSIHRNFSLAVKIYWILLTFILISPFFEKSFTNVAIFAGVALIIFLSWLLLSRKFKSVPDTTQPPKPTDVSSISAPHEGSKKFAGIIGVIATILLLVGLDIAFTNLRGYSSFFFLGQIPSVISLAMLFVEMTALVFMFRWIKGRTENLVFPVLAITLGVIYMVIVPFTILTRLSTNPYIREIGMSVSENGYGALTPFISPYLLKTVVVPELQRRDIKTVSGFESGLNFNTDSVCFFKDFRKSESWGAPVLLWNAEFTWPSDSFVSEARWKPRLGFVAPTGFTPLLRDAYENVGLEYINFSTDKRTGTFVFAMPSQISLFGLYNTEAISLLKSEDLVIGIRITEPRNIRYAARKERVPQQIQEKIKMVLNNPTTIQLSMPDKDFGRELCAKDMQPNFQPNQYSTW